MSLIQYFKHAVNLLYLTLSLSTTVLVLIIFRHIVVFDGGENPPGFESGVFGLIAISAVVFGSKIIFYILDNKEKK